MITVRQAVSATLSAARSAALARESRTKLLTASIGALVMTASLSWTPQALAQQAPASSSSSSTGSSSSGDQLQEVEVTGSRIKRTTDFTTASPTTVIDETAMENAGIVNVGDVLAMTPANISNFTPSTTGNSAFNTGAYIPDLGGLNPFFGSRTLTLIDGQRAVSTSTMDSFDLNFVPQVLVQRIDTVTGGGSALYGSGAVGGVVNVILDHQLEGGKFNADTYDTHYNDGKTNHVSAAYGFGIADNRVHIVIGGEYQKQDAASCQYSGRAWCAANYGPYTTGYATVNGAPSYYATTQVLGSGLTTNTSPSGLLGTSVLGAPFYNSYNLNTNPGALLYTGSSDGLGLLPYSSNNGFNGGTAPGGSGEPVNEYTNLLTAVTRGVITGLVTAKITDNITMSVDLNWGKVEAFNPSDNFGAASGILGTDNPYLATAGGPDWETGGSVYDGGVYPSAAFAKDFSSQINFGQYNDTTLKQVAVGLDGKVGNTSWTWDARGMYGLTQNVEAGQEFTVMRSSMALDTTAAGACRVGTGGLANIAAAANSALPYYGYGGYNGTITLPTYLQTYDAVESGGFDPVSPVSGLTELQTLNYLSQGCQPLNPIGNQPFSAATANYATNPLALALRQTMTAFNINTSGNIWKGIGAGPFSLAVGYEWHQEVTDNDFATCPGARNTLSNSGLTQAQQDCLAITTDFASQYGNDYGGATTMNEIYTELDLPLLKNAFLAKTLELDIAGRDSFYTNKALYGVDVVPGTEGTGQLPTWKASLVWEPVEGIRFRGSQSHDSRDPDPRDLYYSQSFVPGLPTYKGIFDAGYCNSGAPSANPLTPIAPSICGANLLGNVNLKPEIGNTTTLGVVFTPPQAPGFQASADWFHVRILDGIEGAGLNGESTCYNDLVKGEAFATNQYCQGLSFNNLYYNTGGAVVNAGTPGAVTGSQAFAQGNVANVTETNTLAYNGGSVDERGVNFSVAYGLALPGSAGTLTARALATWVGEQEVADQPGSAPVSVLGTTGTTSVFLQNYQAAARWRGNMSITWNVGNFNLTPTINWVGEGILGTNDISCNQTAYNTAGTLCNWVALGGSAGVASELTTAQQKAWYAYYTNAATVAPLAILPEGVTNHVPFYFTVGLNASYTLDKIPGLKAVTLWGQVNNLLNKTPPFTDATVSSPAFYDLLGQAYRVGFRVTF